jgi:hypothetical protein
MAGVINALRVLASCSLAITYVGCSRPSGGIVFWPGVAERKSPLDFVVDPARQLDALRHAQPGRDAEAAFRSGDLRLVGYRPSIPFFEGVPDDALVRSLSGLRGRYGFKVIAFNDVLLTNKEYLLMKHEYEVNYNRTMYRLVQPVSVERSQKSEALKP